MEHHCNLKSPFKIAETSDAVIIHGAAEHFTWFGAFRDYFLSYQKVNIFNVNFGNVRTFKTGLKTNYECFHKISKPHKDKTQNKYNSVYRIPSYSQQDAISDLYFTRLKNLIFVQHFDLIIDNKNWVGLSKILSVSITKISIHICLYVS